MRQTTGSLGAEDDVDPAVGVHRLAHLSNLQPERRVLKRFLHLPRPEHAQITALFSRAAVAVLAGKFFECRLLKHNVRFTRFSASTSLQFKSLQFTLLTI